MIRRFIKMGIGRGGGAAAAPLLRATFDGADATALADYMPETGAGFSAVAGTFQLTGNKLVPATYENSEAVAFADPGHAKLTISATLTPFKSGTAFWLPGIMFRVIDNNNYLLLQIDVNLQKVQIYKRVSGAFTVIEQLDKTIVSGTEYDVTVAIDKSDVVVTIPALEIDAWTITDHNNPLATKIGFRAGRGGTPAQTCAFDDLTVHEIPTAVPVPLFARYASNPVILKGAAGSWEDVDVAAPDVVWDDDLKTYVMAYSGYDGASWHLGIAYSNDLLTWAKDESNPVFSPNAHENGLASNGSIIKIGSTYYHYYQCGAVTPELHAATSPDLKTWTRANNGNAILTGGVFGSFDYRGLFDFHARLSSDGEVVLYYGARDNDYHRTIGWATATASDPLNFTKHGMLIDTPDDWGAIYNFGAPQPVLINGQLCMFFDFALTSNQRRVGFAYPSGGSYHHDYALWIPPPGASWESVQVSDVSAVWKDGTLHLIYCGATAPGGGAGMDSQIGIATWTP